MSEREIAHKVETAWAINTKKDFCKVGNTIIPFDIICDLSKAISYSPNVTANSSNTLTVTHKIQGVVGNAGQGLESGVSQLAGEVILTNGSPTVLINGKSSVRDGDACLMNCSAAGKSNVPGKIYTSTTELYLAQVRETMKGVPLPIPWEVAEEGTRAAIHSVGGWMDSIETLWQATGFTASDADTAAARSRLGAGLQFVGDLFGGPPPEMVMYAGLTGNTEALKIVDELQARQLAAWRQVGDGLQRTWNESYERNGYLGAIAYMCTSFGMEGFVGPKGLGTAGKLAVKGIGLVSGKALSAIARVMGSGGSLIEKVAQMEKEIAAARAAGASAEDIAALAKARDELAAAAKAKGPGDGVYIAANSIRRFTTRLSQDIGRTIESIKNGGDNLLVSQVMTEGGALDIMAEVKINGNQLHLDSLTIYGANGDIAKNTILKDLYAAKSNLTQAAIENGFSEIRITAIRVPSSTSINPGRAIDRIFPAK